MPNREIAPKEMVLFIGGPRLARVDFEVRVAAEKLALRRIRLELGGEDANRDAGRAIDAAWTVSDGLAAAEADAAERLVELARVAACELSKNLPLDLARKVRTRARVRDEELREAEWCAHPPSLQWLHSRLCDW